MNAGDRDLLASSPSRHRTLVAVAMLAALVLLTLGIWLGRATATVTGTAGEGLESAGPGPTNVINGVPVGYARTLDGAVAAAANYTVLLGGKQNMDPAFGAEAYPVFALPEVADDLLGRSEDFALTVDDPVALAQDPSLLFHPAPLGYRVDRYSRSEATIAVWAMVAGVGTPELPVATAWGTEELTLRWVDGDWRIAAMQRDSGPTPPTNGVMPAADLAGRMRSFRPFTYLPGMEP